MIYTYIIYICILWFKRDKSAVIWNDVMTWLETYRSLTRQSLTTWVDVCVQENGAQEVVAQVNQFFTEFVDTGATLWGCFVAEFWRWFEMFEMWWKSQFLTSGMIPRIRPQLYLFLGVWILSHEESIGGGKICLRSCKNQTVECNSAINGGHFPLISKQGWTWSPLTSYQQE